MPGIRWLTMSDMHPAIEPVAAGCCAAIAKFAVRAIASIRISFQCDTHARTARGTILRHWAVAFATICGRSCQAGDGETTRDNQLDCADCRLRRTGSNSPAKHALMHRKIRSGSNWPAVRSSARRDSILPDGWSVPVIMSEPCSASNTRINSRRANTSGLGTARSSETGAVRSATWHRGGRIGVSLLAIHDSPRRDNFGAGDRCGIYPALLPWNRGAGLFRSSAISMGQSRMALTKPMCGFAPPDFSAKPAWRHVTGWRERERLADPARKRVSASSSADRGAESPERLRPSQVAG